MNAKLIIVVFCALHVVSGQLSNNNEQDVLDILNIMDEELNDLLLYVDSTKGAFNAKLALKLQQLRFQKTEAIYTLELQGTQSKLASNVNITPCLTAAQNNMTIIILDAEYEYHDLSVGESDTFIPIYDNLTSLITEQKNFSNAMRKEVEECKSLGSVEAITVCINGLIPTLLQKGEQIFYIIVEQRTLLGDAFDLAEDNQKTTLKQIQDELDVKFYDTEDELATCIDKLNSLE